LFILEADGTEVGQRDADLTLAEDILKCGAIKIK
jgi:hypothetical protein